MVTKKKLDYSYSQQHLKNFLISHPAIRLHYIESECEMPKNTLHHFVKERRNLPLKHFEVLEEELSNYGYTPLNDE